MTVRRESVHVRLLVPVLGFALSSMLVPTAWAGTGCEDYSSHLHTTGLLEWANGRDIEVRGDFAYVATTNVFLVFDGSDPANPVVVSEFDGATNCRDLALYGGYAYLTSGETIRVLDISDPQDVAQVHSVPLAQARDVTVDGSLLYASSPNMALTIFDLTDPTAPAVIGTYGATSAGTEITLDGSFAYVVRGATGIDIVNVSDPASPVLVSNIPTPNVCTRVVVRDGYAYAGCWGADGLRVYDVTDPSLPVEVGSGATGFDVYDLAFVGDLVGLVGDGNLTRGGLAIFDVSNPTDPFVVASHAIDLDGTGCLAYENGIIYTAGSQITILDATTPTSVTPIYDYTGPQVVVDVAGVGGLLIEAGEELLTTIDISDPDAPVQLGTLAAPDAFTRVILDGTLAYVGDASQGLLIVDVSDPAVPTVLSSVDPGPGASKFVVGGGYAYVIDRFNGFHLIDVSDPSAAFYVANLGTAYGIDLVGSRLFRTDQFGLWIHDVSETPASLPVLGRWPDLSGWLADVLVDDDHAYVRGYQLEVIDVSDPTSPLLVGQSLHLPPSDGGISLRNNTVYVAGVRMTALDVSSPESPTILGGIDAPNLGWFRGNPEPVGEVIFIGSQEGTWGVPAQCFDPTSVPSAPNAESLQPLFPPSFPNPMSDSIQLSVGAGAPGQIRIVDVEGRLVFQTQIEAAATSTNRVWEWDGRNLDGHAIGSGVYFYRWAPRAGSDSGQGMFEERIVVLR